MGQNGMKQNKIRSYFCILMHQCEGGYLIFVVPTSSGYFKKAKLKNRQFQVLGIFFGIKEPLGI
jgi:hypothetical protein